MANPGLGGQNLFALYTPTLVSGSWEATLPLANLLKRSRADSTRSTNDDAASTVFRVDWGSAKTARALSISWHNLSSAATWRWKRGTSAGASDVDDSGSLNVWQFTPYSYDGTIWHAIIVRPAATSARHDEVAFTDTSNPDNYVQIAARPWMGDLFVPHAGPVEGERSLTLQDLSTVSRTEGGSLQVISRSVIHGERVVLPYLSESEKTTVRQILAFAGTTGEILWIPDVNDAATAQAEGFVGTFESLSDIEQRHYAKYGVPLAMKRA